MLLYLYWEPTNAAELLEFRQHKDEIRHFSQKVESSKIKFETKSYLDLWDDWAKTIAWDGAI